MQIGRFIAAGAYQQITAYSNWFNVAEAGFPDNVLTAYASTDCGELITGTSGALKQKIKESQS